MANMVARGKGDGMYADYSRDQVNAFLSELTRQTEAGAVERMAESFSDEMLAAHMELSRYKKAHANGERFIPRADLLPKRARLHPADFQ